MQIKNLNVQNCRLLKNITLNFSPHLNLIIGENASGKTSLLEALTLLSSGKSFRTSHISDVISYKKDFVLISALINKKSGNSQFGIEKTTKSTKIRINKKDVYSQAELSLHLPITAIHPDSVDLITGTPGIRRSYIDWLAFYLFPDFHKIWKEYRHILKQRNLCLKSQKHRYALLKWTEKLVESQPLIIKFRKEALLLIEPILLSVTEKLLNTDKIGLELKTGFPTDLKLDKDSLLKFYKIKEPHDLKLHRTSHGVHCADLKITLGDQPAKECASRGQLKLLAISLLLAQSSAISNSYNNEKGIILIDDLAAELDINNKEKLLNYLNSLKQQIIITSTKKPQLPNIDFKMFHVKHGDFREAEK